MNFRLFTFGFLIALVGLSRAPAQTNNEALTVPLEFESAFTADGNASIADPAFIWVTLDSTTYIGQATTPGPASIGLATKYLKPGKVYNISVSSVFVSDFTLTFAPPSGHRLFIDDVEKRTISVTGSGAIIKVRILDDLSLGLGEASQLRPGRLVWGVGLGRLRNGEPAGTISLREAGITSTTFTPSALIYDYDAVAIEVIRPSGILRQILTDQCLVDITAPNSDSVRLRFFERTSVGSSKGGDGLWPIIGGSTPIYDYTIVNPNPGTYDKIRITKVVTQGGVTRNWWTELTKTSASQWSAVDWSTTAVGTVGASTREWVYSSLERDEVVTVKSGGGTVASKTRRLYTNYAWGDELTQEIRGNDLGNPDTATREYHAAPNAGSTGRLKWSIAPTGTWIRYDYNNVVASRGLVERI